LVTVAAPDLSAVDLKAIRLLLLVDKGLAGENVAQPLVAGADMRYCGAAATACRSLAAVRRLTRPLAGAN